MLSPVLRILFPVSTPFLTNRQTDQRSLLRPIQHSIKTKSRRSSQGPTMPDLCCYPCLLGTASPTNIIREWLQEWHDEHDITFDPDLKFEIAWDARWILDSSAEELESDLVNWGCNLATSKRIAKDLMAMKGAKKANMGEGGIIQEISYVGDEQHTLCVTQWWFRGASCALAVAMFLFLITFMALGQVVQQLHDCRRDL